LLALQSFETTHNFFHLPDTHPAILHPESKSIDWKDVDFTDVKPYKQNLLVGDSFPSKQVRPLDWNFKHPVKASLLVDDSHGLGFTGTEGSGVFKTIDKTRFEEILMVASLGKALGINGGVIAGSRARIEKIKKLSSFAGASGMNPAALAAFLQADNLYANQRQKLIDNISYFDRKANLLRKHFIFDKNYPVVYSQHPDIAAFLQSRNIVIAHFDYPNPGQTLNRIVLTAAHNSEDLDTLAIALQEFTHQKK
jgi:7-keto-8-aminopelargonate synthetase-like enzyme